jgi:hypothetical protein
MDITETGLENVAWMHVTQNKNYWVALVNTVMNLRVPLKARNLLTS